MFKVGKVYKRKEEIHGVHGGQGQGGISTPSGKPFIFLFTSLAGEAYGYSDQFQPDGMFWYTGEGQVGDMKMNKSNLAISSHIQNQKTIHLFEYVKSAYVRYIGEVTCTGHHIEERPDRNLHTRNAIIFHLAITDIDSDGGNVIVSDSLSAEMKKFRSASLQELRKAALLKTQGTTKKKEVTVVTAVRSEAIKLYARKRAQGKCEGCEKDAPFQTKKGPFLEVHHVHRLSDGGPDHPENVIAICPNCHRNVHLGVNGMAYNKELIKKLEAIEGAIMDEFSS